ncbi:MAG: glycosyltransferase family 9 protein [Candidatus Goldbacteria bacterium]|nr:glycosyltransferase family 9 protein [Candidatus Goldiibacteriota bacterium]
MKILIIRLSSTGDIILTSSVIKFLKNNIPDCKIHMLVKEQFEKVALLIGSNKVLKFKTQHSFIKDFFSLNKLINQINDEKYDIIIDLHSNIRTFFILIFSKAKIKEMIDKDIIKRRFLVYFKWSFGIYKTVIEKYLQAAKKALLKFGIVNPKNVYNKNIINKKIKNIIVHIGARWKLKRWPYFFELVQKISKIKGIKIFITGVKEEIEKNDKILYIKSNNINNLIGKTSFDKLAHIIKNSDLFIGNDTAAAHLAWYYNIPAVIMMGPTVAEFGFISGKNFHIIERKLTCRPCNLHGGNICPIGTFECMRDIKPDTVFTYIKNLIKANNV